MNYNSERREILEDIKWQLKVISCITEKKISFLNELLKTIEGLFFVKL